MAAMLASSTLGMGFDREPVRPSLVPWLETADRQVVADAYQAAIADPVPDLSWTGSRDGCDPGTSSPTFRTATIGRVNFYRAMAGVPAIVTENPTLSAKAQQAAMMMSAQGQLSHDPGRSFACYTTIGHEAAANSNLYLGRNGPNAIDGYIEDPGQANADVGHRNTILHPPTQEMGVGDIDRTAEGYSANALWVFDQRVFDEAFGARQPTMREPERFVAWPPRGYVPAALVHPRWSFTRGGIDTSEAQVAMYDLGAPAGQQSVPLEVVDRNGAPGQVPLPTVVWEPQISPGADADTDYLVVITSIRPEQPVLASVPAPSSDDTSALEPAAPSAAAPVERQPVSSVYAYTVRVMGLRANGALTASEALGRIVRSS